jgi:two-component system chemotaxis response regulator CheB
VGIALSGGLDDGTLGLQAIKQHGGIAIVQDPKEAFDPSMPESAIRNVNIDHVLPVKAMPVSCCGL